MLDPRAQLLRAALGFSTAPCPRMTESCTRLVHLAGLVGRDRARHRGDAPCFDLQLTQYDEKGWRATFYTTGMEHSPTSATGTGWSARRGMRCKVQRGSALLHASITPGGTVQ